MKQFAFDFIIVFAILIVGLGLMGDLDKFETFAFSAAVGVLNATLRYVYARFRRSKRGQTR